MANPGDKIDFSQYEDYQKAVPNGQIDFEQYQSLPKQPMPELSNPAIGTQVGKGAAKGLLNTTSGISSAIHSIPAIGPKIVPTTGLNAMHEMATPKTDAEKLGYYGEQAGEFLLPGGLEEKAGALAAEHLPQAARYAAPAARIATSALTSGTLNKLQGGDFKTGAEMGAGGTALGEAGRAIAPSLAESSLGIGKRQRGYGKTPGMAVLEETKGVRPETIEKSAQSVLGSLNRDIATMAKNHQGQVSLQGALDAVDNRLAQAMAENNAGARDQLLAVRKALSESINTGMPIPVNTTAEDALNLKRGLRKQFVSNWNPETMHGTRAAAAEGSHAIDANLDTALGPDFAKKNQRISSLIPVQERAESISRNAGLTQRLAHRIAAHTGALTGAVVGGEAGYRHGGAQGALGGATLGLVLPELIASPTGEMIAARALHSGVTARALIGAGAQFNRKSKIPEQTSE